MSTYAYEDNAGQVFLYVDATGEIWDATPVVDQRSGFTDLSQLYFGVTTDWTLDRYPSDNVDLDAKTLIAEYDGRTFIAHEIRMGSNAREYFNMRDMR